MEIKTPTELMKSRCKELGKEYSIKVIDCENVIYRKINTYFDIEISGINNNRVKSFDVDVYLWRVKPHQEILEKIYGVKSMEALKTTLNQLVGKYQDLT